MCHECAAGTIERVAALDADSFGIDEDAARAAFRVGHIFIAEDRRGTDVASGELKVVIDRTFPLAEAAAAHSYIEGRSAFGRVLLTP